VAAQVYGADETHTRPTTRLRLAVPPDYDWIAVAKPTRFHHKPFAWCVVGGGL